MKAIKSESRTNDTDVQLRKAQLYKEIEAIRVQLRQLDKKKETPGTPSPADTNGQIVRKPGRFKGKFVVGPEFFEPLTDEEIRELMGE